MRKLVRSFLLGTLMTLLIFGLSIAVAYLKLIVSGHSLSYINSHIGTSFVGVLRIALVGGVAIFLLSFIGGPRSRPPH